MPERERHTEPVQVLLTPSRKAEFVEHARRRGVPASTLLRIIVTEWLDEHRDNDGSLAR